jgi:hypothetical protein
MILATATKIPVCIAEWNHAGQPRSYAFIVPQQKKEAGCEVRPLKDIL